MNRRPDNPQPDAAHGRYYGVLVHQATGMVAVQANCAIPAALDLLVEHALRHESSVGETASDVINRRLRFES